MYDAFLFVDHQMAGNKMLIGLCGANAEENIQNETKKEILMDAHHTRMNRK